MFEAGVGTRMFERAVDTCTSEEEADSSVPGQEAGIRKSELEADTCVSHVEADTCILSRAVGSRLRGVGASSVPRQHSIAVEHRQCMQPAASEHSSTTSMIV
jgi:hypothetical protein